MDIDVIYRLRVTTVQKLVQRQNLNKQAYYRSSKAKKHEPRYSRQAQPEHIKHASLFSREHANLASSSSRSFWRWRAAAYSGSTSFPAFVEFEEEVADDEVEGIGASVLMLRAGEGDAEGVGMLLLLLLRSGPRTLLDASCILAVLSVL